MAQKREFFRNLHEGKDELDPEKFLLEVESQFRSEEIHDEVRWRLQVLRQLTTTEGMEEASRGLRKELSRIFATLSNEGEVLERLKDLTEVEGADGGPVDLRRFVKREKRAYPEEEYRKVLLKKIQNTSAQIKNLIVFFPNAHGELIKLAEAMEALAGSLHNPASAIQQIKAREDELRGSPAFGRYEKLKEEFLRQWLGRFTHLSEQEIKNLSAEEIQRLITEHQRHQMTQLLKSEIKPSALDMAEHLDPHDTLETTFKDKEFWKGANAGARRGFRDWIIGAIQAYGMLKGQRYAMFQNDKEPDAHLLFGIGVGGLSGGEQLLEMVPFVKPFTRKAGYLLEIRRRDIGEVDEYYAELRHYVMPFLFAFDAMKEFKISAELISFFTSKY